MAAKSASGGKSFTSYVIKKGLSLTISSDVDIWKRQQKYAKLRLCLALVA